MTEDEARAWMRDRWADRFELVERYVAMLLDESQRQNLIARSTFDTVWSRHIVDSAQLVPLGPDRGSWLDVGSGGGLPGVVVAILRDAPVTLCEPRSRRAEFLRECVASLALNCCVVEAVQANRIVGAYAVVSARAVASIDKLLSDLRSCVSRETVFLLPRGLNASNDVSETQRSWKGSFHMEQSVTSDQSGIVVATGVAKR